MEVINKKNENMTTIDPNMRDYSKDPLVLKKVASARAFIAKNGLPKKTRAKKSK